MKSEMHVIKRNGQLEDMSFDKILKRVKSLGLINHLSINYTTLVIKIIEQLYDNIETYLIDELTAQQSASMSS
ncbi:MAG: ATP cone domain-containing protein, partial [Acidimicrobiales bacterium]|nr:ATP cone domain-containing protein [Acidimicrobiales bacterium]